jgi:hypothetical protein
MKNWSVEIKIDGESKLYISHNELSGVDNVADYTDEIRHCAESLLGFIGAAAQHSVQRTADVVPCEKHGIEYCPDCLPVVMKIRRC